MKPLSNPKILVAVPYHHNKKYSLNRLMDKVQNLTYKNIEVVMRWDLGEYGGKDNVKKQREFFRKMSILQGYDYLFFMGVDTIPPDDVLERLLSHDKLIVGGVYWGRHDAANGKPEGAVAWIHALTPEEQNKTFSTMNNLFEVDGMGMDCVLFHRNILERISWLSWEQNDDDYPFYDRALQLGVKTFLDSNVQCKHYFTKDGYSYLGKSYINGKPIDK
jgi:hypothetical protein